MAGPCLSGQPVQAEQALDSLLEIFGRGQVYVEVQRHRRRDDRRLGHALAALAHGRGLLCVATGNVHYLARDDADLHDALTSIRERLPLPQTRRAARKRCAPTTILSAPGRGDAGAVCRLCPAPSTTPAEIAERCTVALPYGLQVLPTSRPRPA